MLATCRFEVDADGVESVLLPRSNLLDYCASTRGLTAKDGGQATTIWLPTTRVHSTGTLPARVRTSGLGSALVLPELVRCRIPA
jgi:hypothetical protein